MISGLVGHVKIVHGSKWATPMTGKEEYRFRIDNYTPATIPMGRLAEYMVDLAKLLGEPSAVHFVRLDESSTVLVHNIDHEAVPKVEDRLDRTRRREGPPDALAAYERLNQRLRSDNTSAVLLRGQSGQVLEFRGRKDLEPITFGAFWQEGAIDGIPKKLGGLKDPVPVQIDSGSIVHSYCYANLSIARKIRHHLFDDELRFHGKGKWLRDDGGKWVLQEFRIAHFDVLDNRPLKDVVAELRAIPGNDWAALKDPWRELDEIRHGPKDEQQEGDAH